MLNSRSGWCPVTVTCPLDNVLGNVLICVSDLVLWISFLLIVVLREKRLLHMHIVPNISQILNICRCETVCKFDSDHFLSSQLLQAAREKSSFSNWKWWEWWYCVIDPFNQHALATQVYIFSESCAGRRCSVAAASLFNELETQNREGRWIAFLQRLWESWSKSEAYWIPCILHQFHREWDVRNKRLINEISIQACMGGERSVN